jgi:citrate lyase subunit beta / citryl-CoA lyase
MEPIPRSYLFVPGNRPDRFAKACAAGADAVIVDLEDAVAPPEKPAAREALAAWLTATQPVHVRINSAATSWFEDDAAICRKVGVAGILLPKTQGEDDVHRLLAITGDVPVVPLIESARGSFNALEIAQCPRVSRLAFGALDFQLDLGIQGDTDELLYFRSQLVLISRLAGLAPPVDGINTEIDDPERLRATTTRAIRLGFGGKLCIHPKQIPHVNACFRPTPEEVAWAKTVVAAASASGGAAVAVQGEMVDQPIILRAERILRESRELPGGWPHAPSKTSGS